MSIELSHRRGDTFSLEFDLPSGWLASHFTGGVVFTLRREIPESSVVDDDDALAQVSVFDGGIEFTTTTHGIVEIPAAVTNTWPIKGLIWDIEARITSGAKVYTIGSGKLRVIADVKRGPAEADVPPWNVIPCDAAARIRGVNLTNEDETLLVSGGGVRVLTSGTLSGETTRTKTLGVTGATAKRALSLSLLDDTAGEIVVIANGGPGGSNLAVHSGIKAFYEFIFDDSGNWVLSAWDEVA